ncbi:MAG: hypothetical protein OJJ54_08130 [Pseudonocardia sp.]|nr:hypothetical protein [Pseudonocardia sp.]
MPRPSDAPRTADLLLAAAASAATTSLALFATPLARELRIVLALVLLTLAGIVCGRVLDRLAPMPATLATGATAAALIVVDDAVALGGTFWVLGLLIYLPGALVLARLAVGTGRVFVPAHPVVVADKRLIGVPRPGSVGPR